MSGLRMIYGFISDLPVISHNGSCNAHKHTHTHKHRHMQTHTKSQVQEVAGYFGSFAKVWVEKKDSKEGDKLLNSSIHDSHIVKDGPFLKWAQNSFGLERTEIRLALIRNWVEALWWKACLITPLKWDYQTHSDGHSSGSRSHSRKSTSSFLKSQQWLREISPNFKVTHTHNIIMLKCNGNHYLPAGLLSPLQQTSVLVRGTGGCSISAASGSASSSSRPTHSPTTRGRNTEL